jgi:hypothetical protein
MEDLIPVKDVAGLHRDSKGVIHNTDKAGFEAYIAHRNKILTEDQRIRKLEEDVGDINTTLKQLLSILQGKA